MRTYGYRIFSAMMIVILVSSAAIRAEEHGHEDTGLPVKCGTPLVMRNMFLGTAKLTAGVRYNISLFNLDTLTESAVSSQNNFRVHYDKTGDRAPDMTDLSNNGIPDYVDSMLVYLEYAWDLMIDQLGYPEPLNDGGLGGGDELDVYINDLGGVYGYTYPDDDRVFSTSAYIEIDNDFSESAFPTKGLDAVRVTTAHEFFHAIHFRYYYNMNLLWWMEQTAVWMEDVAWDDVNDYIYYLNIYFQSKNVALDENDLYGPNSSFKYGATIWAHFLAKRFGNDIIKDIWQYLSESKRIDIGAFDIVLQRDKETGLSGALGEFAVWNYFLNDSLLGIYRANTVDFYPDSDIFGNSVGTDLTAMKSPSNDNLLAYRLTNRYAELIFVGDWAENDTIYVEVTPLNDGEFTNSLVLFNGPYDYRIHTMQSTSEYIPLDGNWEKAVLVTACTNTTGFGSFSYQLKTDMIEGTVNVENEQPLAAFSINGAFPNPFNPATTISFTLPEPGEVSVRAYNALGQNAEDIFIGHLDAGEKHILWKPSNLSGGVYLINITTSQNSATTKTLFLK